MPDSVAAQSFLMKRDRSLGESLVALILLPFAFVYWIATLARRMLYRIGILRSIRLPAKVVSVGGITIGGSGKTPVVMHIAEFLESIGRKTIILTRGYGGEAENVTILGPDVRTNEQRLSDEVKLMRKKVASVIGVGPDRVASFRKAAESMEFDVAILDDGFQHLRIERDIDIVSLSASAPFGNGYMLPSGNLREPKSALRRADVIVIAGIPRPDNATEITIRSKTGFSDSTVISADYVSDGMSDIHSGEGVDPEAITGQPIFAFAAIANPDVFFSMLEREGLKISGRRAFRDHHIFTQKDIDSLVVEAQSINCRAFVVTEKDAVKLGGLRFSSIAVYEFRIRLQIGAREASLCEAIERMLDD